MQGKSIVWAWESPLSGLEKIQCLGLGRSIVWAREGPLSGLGKVHCLG